MSDRQPVFTAQPYQGIATFGRAPFQTDPRGANVAVLGAPFDGGTSYRSGTRLGPRAIREQSLLLWGYNNAQQVNPFTTLRIFDGGDVDVVPVDIERTHRAIEQRIAECLTAGAKVLLLGGDHSVSLPALRAHAQRHGPLGLVHFDAHPDTWSEEFPGCRYSHGTPFRRALEEGLVSAGRYVQVGIRGPTAGPEDYADVEELGIRILTMDAVMEMGIERTVEEIRKSIGSGPTYVTVDIDVVDPAFAPGTGTPEVGGLTSWQLLRLLRGLRGVEIVGSDLVEVCPAYDPTGITAILGANVAFEFLSLWSVGGGERK